MKWSLVLFFLMSKRNPHEGYSFRKNLSLINFQGWILLFSFVCIWLYVLDTKMMFEVILMSLTYSAIEYTWYMNTLQMDDGSVQIIPLRVPGRVGFTSWEQLIGNILYVPFALNGYSSVFSTDGYSRQTLAVMVTLIRILLFPVNIWLLEIIQDRIMKWLMGFNPAWNYTGAPGSRFDGAINLAHWKLWIILGCISVVANPFEGSIFILCCVVIIQILKYCYVKKHRN